MVFNYISKADNYNNQLTFYALSDLSNFTNLKRKVSTRYFDTIFYKERYVKAVITNETAELTRVAGGFTNSNREVRAILMYDSTCFPLILVDHLHASGTYPITYKAFKYSFTNGRNTVFY